ncbi:MAG: DUF1552 domain-containing protein [Myxococcaceae bacterium]|nr:DUF1552 domain-containing protein [Myxococcaceae bacterium]
MFKHTRLAQLDRRSFLRGLGTTAVALPFFDFFLDARQAQAQAAGAAPKRFIVMRMGESPSTDGDSVRDVSGRVRNFLSPTSYGPQYGLSNGIASLGSYAQLRPYVGVFSNLDLPWLRGGNTPLDQIPPGAYYDSGFHSVNGYTYLTGRRCFMHDDYSAVGWDYGPSCDWLMKTQLDPMNRLQHINVRGQPGVGGSRGVMTFNTGGQPVSPNDSPRLFFQNMFSMVQTGPTTVVDPVAKLALDQRKSVLDLLDRDRLAFLSRELSPKEKAMLSTHLDEIREIERRINALPIPTMPGGVCQRPADPGADPAVTSTQYTPPGDNQQPQTIRYAGEDERMNVLIDLVAMALACDISRFGTFRICGDQPTGLNSHFITGYNVDVHQVGHYGAPMAAAGQVAAWGASKFFRLAEALRTKAEGAGNVLDNTALVYTTDGGSDDGVQNVAQTHAHGNHVLLVAGKVGGLKVGSAVNMNRKHPCGVLLAAMRACGYSGNLGDISAHASEVWS